MDSSHVCVVLGWLVIRDGNSAATIHQPYSFIRRQIMFILVFLISSRWLAKHANIIHLWRRWCVKPG